MAEGAACRNGAEFYDFHRLLAMNAPDNLKKANSGGGTLSGSNRDCAVRELEAAVVDIVTDFLGKTGAAVDGCIDRALARLGAVLQLDRAAIFLISMDDAYAWNTHEWCAPGIPSWKQGSQALSMANCPSLLQRLEETYPLSISNAGGFPDVADSVLQEVRSFLILPMMCDRRVDGFLLLSAVEGREEWSREAELLLPVVAGTFARTLGCERLYTRPCRLNARSHLVQNYKSLGILTAGIAHDFNNLIMGILGNAELAMADVDGDSAVSRNLNEISKLSLRASDLVKQMLAYSGKGHYFIEAVDMNSIIQGMIGQISTFMPEGIETQYRLMDSLPTIEADANQMRQVLVNLTRNATEAIGENPGRIVIATDEVTLSDDFLKNSCIPDGTRPGQHVCISVSDTGNGIAPEARSNIFDPFFTTKPASRGLGLAAVLGIVRSHKGTITLESSLNNGTVFTVYLPACE